MTAADWLAGLFYFTAIVGFLGGIGAIMVAVIGNAIDWNTYK